MTRPAAQSARRSASVPACPCGGVRYADCCARFIEAGTLPPTAEALMRSRYTAYVLANEPYLRKTWCSRTRPPGALLEEPRPQWLGLTVVSSNQEPGEGSHATVEFIARYKINGRAAKLHEVSRFLREPDDDGNLAWCYVDGQFR